jgi:hypothetical protein
VVDAHRSYFNIEIVNSQVLRQIALDWLPRLRAQPSHAVVRVVTGKRRQIHASYGAEKPGSLPIFFNRAARDVGLRSPFDRAGIDANLGDPIQIQRDAAIREQRFAVEVGNCILRA